MADRESSGEHDRREAQRFYRKAKESEKLRDYDSALEYYRKSISLHDDEKVREEYLRLLSEIGPM
ncbi:MAG: tetratricopeptide repeat protein [Pseudomonadota bacterium]